MKIPVWAVLPLFQTSPREVTGMVRAAESVGCEGTVATDHLAGWRRPSDPVLEATSVLGMAAAVAERRLGSLVLQTSLRSPSYTADVAATLVGTCRQPPLIGLGVGDSRSRREFERLGMVLPPLARRLEVLKRTIREVRRRAPQAEIWVGGWRTELLEIAAERADGWNGWGREIGAFEAAVDHLLRVNPHVKISWGAILDTAKPVASHRRELVQRSEAGAQTLVLALTPPRADGFLDWAPQLLSRPIFGGTGRCD